MKCRETVLSSFEAEASAALLPDSLVKTRHFSIVCCNLAVTRGSLSRISELRIMSLNEMTVEPISANADSSWLMRSVKDVISVALRTRYAR